MLFITEKAAEMVRISASGLGLEEGELLRVSALRGEHGRVGYKMGFDHRREQDTLWECQGVSILVDPASRPLLENVVLDFQDLPGGGPQFAFVAAREEAGSA